MLDIPIDTSVWYVAAFVRKQLQKGQKDAQKLCCSFTCVNTWSVVMNSKRTQHQ